MDVLIFLKALLLGIIEGLTEFLPISSTGHLIVFESLLDFHSKGKVFEIAIQLGAVLAVVVEYRQRFVSVLKGLGRDAAANRFVLNLAVAFIPAAVMGLLFSKQIKEKLFNPLSVAVALVVGALVILWVEKRSARTEARVQSVDDMRIRDALVVGLAQVLALVPGPVMVAATAYDVFKHRALFTLADIGLIAVGFCAAFVAGLLAVRALLKFVSAKNYVPFAYYRIVFGGVILLTYWAGWVKW